ncbi:MAG TPA: hypothetical protein VJG90_06255 [Candidatus Nanoarchaeia archaeon]|nr:hypothetical protein [Candidatus Nanoarchaeia archaeon]
MKAHKSQKEIKNHNGGSLIIVGSVLLFLLLIAGCDSSQAPPVPTPAPPSESTPTSPVAPPIVACTTKECFISAANDCKDLQMTLTENAGVFKYASSTDCIFTKTLVTLSVSETQEMKSLLEGKSLTCKYEKGKFDSRWATSLMFGTEYCEGELRDIIVELLVFS